MTHKAQAGSRGYTLLEMAVVFAVVGIILGAGAMAYSIYHKNKVEAENANNMRVISSYMNSFLMQRGRYPCPARLDATRGDPDYGLEGDCTDTSVAVGTCASGICVEEGARQVDINPEPSVTDMQTVRVRRGALPFRSLAMPEKQFLDGYKMRYNYAITEILASPGTYQRESGAIAIVDGLNQTIIEPAGSAHFVIFSSGPDKAGAYTLAGRPYLPCDTAALDGENCNTSTANNLAVYRMMERSHGGGADYFDDDVRFYSSVETPLWQVADASGAHIRDLIEAESGGKIGIGTNAPDVTLDVGGNVRSEEQVRLTELCSLTGTDCFQVSSIGGDDPMFQCDNPARPDYDPAKPYVSAIGMNKVTCSDTPEIRCPAGQMVAGINADNGSLICQAFTPPPMCPPQTFTQCQAQFPPNGLSVTLPATPVSGGVQLGPWFFDPSGVVSRRMYAYCIAGTNGAPPAWQWPNYYGSCDVCVEGTQTGVTDATTCGALLGYGGWTGTVTADVITSCTGPYTPVLTVNPTSNTCTCIPMTSNNVMQCPPGYTSGNITEHKNWVCDTATTGHWETVGTTNTCSCGASTTQTQTVSCPTGYSGSWTQTKTQLSCPPAVWGPWTPAVPPAGACTCNSGPYTTTQSCPAGYTGTGVVMQANFDCATGTMGPYDTQVAFNCSVTAYSWVTGGTPSSLGSQVGPLAGSTCTTPGATSACSVPAGAQFQPYSACTCQ